MDTTNAKLKQAALQILQEYLDFFENEPGTQIKL